VSDQSDLALCVDLGTGGPKIALVTLDGQVVAHEVHHVETHYGADGEASQDAEEWWTLVIESSRRLLESSRAAPRVRAVAVTGQYASTVPVDEIGVPTGPCLTWLDTRGGRYSRPVIGGSFQGYNARKALQFMRRTGGGPSPTGADPVGQVLHLTHEESELVARTRWFMEPVDYLTMRFCGVASATHASRLAMWMTDNRRLDLYEYDRHLASLVGVDVAYLPPLLPLGAVIGNVTPEIARQLGISTDTVVVTGVPDLHAAAIGAGATRLYDTHLALSTTSWISCPLPKKKTDISHSIAAVPGLTNDSYLMINSQDTGAKALEWLQGVLAGDGPTMSFDEMTKLAATSPPGANGVVFTPWLTGERSPVGNKRLRAGFTNLSITTTTADLIRAVMEGVAANSAWLFTYVEKFTGQQLSPVRLLGGGAQSTLWCQIYADTLDREVIQVPEALLCQLRGVALLASVALRVRTLDEITTNVKGTSFQPAPEAAALYRSQADRLASLYQRDKKWSKARRRSSR
jgi:xylulokinase